MPKTETSPRLHFQEIGNGGPRVLLLMGFAMRGRVWKPQVDGLRQDHRLVFFDNRGIGDSESKGKVWTMKLLAQDALRVMDQVGWDDCHVVGVSMGGMMAQQLVLQAPERVKSLSLIATHPGGRLRFVPKQEGLRRFMEANLKADGRIQAMQQLLYPQHFLDRVDRGDLEARMAEQVGGRTSRRTAMRQLGAVLSHRTASRLSTINAPTLVIKPELDILIRPANSDYLHQKIPNAEMLVLPDAGHGAVFQEAKQINERLRRHFQAHQN